MSAKQRTDRLNTLLREVIIEVIRRDLHHLPHIDEFISITHVDITRDLSFAKVYVAIIGDENKKQLALQALQQHAGKIGRLASKKVIMRHFPQLSFIFDEGLEQQLKMDALLSKISRERADREERQECSHHAHSDFSGCPDTNDTDLS